MRSQAYFTNYFGRYTIENKKKYFLKVLCQNYSSIMIPVPIAP